MRTLKMFPVLMLAAALPALAQAPSGFSASAAVAAGTQSLREFTGNGAGFALDGAWETGPNSVPCRFGLSLSSFGAGTHTVTDANGNPMTADGPGLLTGQVYAALRTDPGPGFKLYLGVSANRHRLTADLGGQGSSQYVQGTKLGARADLEYHLTPRVALVCTFQWVEVGLAPSGQAMDAPSWFQAGARWSF